MISSPSLRCRGRRGAIEECVGLGNRKQKFAEAPSGSVEFLDQTRRAARVLLGLRATIGESCPVGHHAGLYLLARRELVGELDGAIELARHVGATDLTTGVDWLSGFEI